MDDVNTSDDSVENGAIVSFVVLSTHRSPRVLVDSVGLPSDRSWQRGDRKGPRSSAIHKFSGIAYQSQLPREAPVKQQVDALVQRLTPFREELSMLARDIAEEEGRDDRVRVWITRQVATGNAGFDISVDHARFFGDIGANIAISIDLMLSPPADADVALLRSP